MTREEFVGVITDHGACSPPCSRCVEILDHEAGLRARIGGLEDALRYIKANTCDCGSDDSAAAALEKAEKERDDVEIQRRYLAGGIKVLEKALTLACLEIDDYSNQLPHATPEEFLTAAKWTPCVMCGVHHCTACGMSRGSVGHPEYCTCP